MYTCSPASDLVCISTNSVDIDGGTTDAGAFKPIFVCRLACTPGEPCPQEGDVCCSGVIHGVTYGKTAACVPASKCDTEDIPLPPPKDSGADLHFLDSSTPDTRPVDAASDAPGDAGPSTADAADGGGDAAATDARDGGSSDGADAGADATVG